MSSKGPKRTKNFIVPMSPEMHEDGVKAAGTPARFRATIRALLEAWLGGRVELSDAEIAKQQRRVRSTKNTKPPAE